MTWMPYYPVWSLTYVAAALLVFYALARYGSRDPHGRPGRGVRTWLCIGTARVPRPKVRVR